MELLQKLGIDWKLIIAQIINFLILLGVLYKFLYKPVLNFLDQRSKKISNSLEKASKIEEDFKNTKIKNEAILIEAKKQAAIIIEEAHSKSEQIHKEKITRTAIEAKEVVEKAKQQILDEKEKMVAAAKDQIADLVVNAAAKVLEGAITKEVDSKFVENILKTVKK